MAQPIRVGVGAGIMDDGRSWLDLARRVEASGFDGLYLSDHPGVSASPFVSLAAAAAVTSTLTLGTYVLNSGVRDPLQVATDAATLDLVSAGRFILGLGAGHTPAEWTMGGHRYPGANDRISRLGEFLDIVTRLLAGHVVTFTGEHLQTSETFLLSPRPVQEPLPILIGGNGLNLLAVASRRADVISLTGLGRTLEDGHRHTADWSAAALDERVELIRRNTADHSPVLDALVQHVELTDDRESAADRIAAMAPGLTPADVLAAPYALIGTAEEVAEEMRGPSRSLGLHLVRRASRRHRGDGHGAVPTRFVALGRYSGGLLGDRECGCGYRS